MSVPHPNLRYFREQMNLLITPCEILWGILPPNDQMRQCYIAQINKSYNEMIEEFRLFTLAAHETSVEKEASLIMINKRKAFQKHIMNTKNRLKKSQVKFMQGENT